MVVSFSKGLGPGGIIIFPLFWPGIRRLAINLHIHERVSRLEVTQTWSRFWGTALNDKDSLSCPSSTGCLHSRTLEWHKRWFGLLLQTTSLSAGLPLLIRTRCEARLYWQRESVPQVFKSLPLMIIKFWPLNNTGKRYILGICFFYHNLPREKLFKTQ